MNNVQGEMTFSNRLFSGVKKNRHGDKMSQFLTYIYKLMSVYAYKTIQNMFKKIRHGTLYVIQKRKETSIKMLNTK